MSINRSHLPLLSLASQEVMERLQGVTEAAELEQNTIIVKKHCQIILFIKVCKFQT